MLDGRLHDILRLPQRLALATFCPYSRTILTPPFRIEPIDLYRAVF
jgi:hypothetical protein